MKRTNIKIFIPKKVCVSPGNTRFENLDWVLDIQCIKDLASFVSFKDLNSSIDFDSIIDKHRGSLSITTE